MYIYAFFEINGTELIPRYVGSSQGKPKNGIYLSEPIEEGFDYTFHRQNPEYSESLKYDRMCDYGMNHPDSDEYLRRPSHFGENSRNWRFVEWIKDKRYGKDFITKVLHDDIETKKQLYLTEFHYVAKWGKIHEGGTLLNYDDGGVSDWGLYKTGEWGYGFTIQDMINAYKSIVKDYEYKPEKIKRKVNPIGKIVNKPKPKPRTEKRITLNKSNKFGKKITLTNRVLKTVVQSKNNYAVFRECFSDTYFLLNNMKKKLVNKKMDVNHFNQLKLSHPKKREILRNAEYTFNKHK